VTCCPCRFAVGESFVEVVGIYFFATVLALAFPPALSVALTFLGAAVFFSGLLVTAPSTFLTAALAFVATEVFFAGAFLVTPTGLAALVVVVAFFGPLFAPVLAVARFLVVAGAVSLTVGKILGLELPVAERVPSRAIISI